MSRRPRYKQATGITYPSESNPGIVQAIGNKPKKKTVARDEPSLIVQQEEEMGRIRPKKDKQQRQAEKKYKRKNDLDSPQSLRPRREGVQKLNASHRRGSWSKANAIHINDPPPQAEQPAQEEYDSDTPTEEGGDNREVSEKENGEEEVNEDQSGGKEGDGEESGSKEGDGQESGGKEGDGQENGGKEGDGEQSGGKEGDGQESGGKEGDGEESEDEGPQGCRFSYEARNVSEYDEEIDHRDAVLP
ncbi:ribosome-binding protein 1-like [Papaver somniferum]|uniref:ribosome-binding protein 1-like n=1 Tax=Papaver somniferum TaxID=3469 RepID=UPI000E6F6CAF|nr:ribosome-binding protein 1-like [Papaver somniferum]